MHRDTHKTLWEAVMNRRHTVEATGAITFRDDVARIADNFHAVHRATRTGWAIGACLALASSAFAQTGPTVVTDLPDYPPGSTVHISGSGFTGSPMVVLEVQHVPPIPPEESCDP